MARSSSSQPFCAAALIMAYSPLEQERVLNRLVVKQIAAEHGATPAQLALAWVLRQEGVIAIPKAATLAHVRENHGALDLTLTQHDLERLDETFPPPTGKTLLEMI